MKEIWLGFLSIRLLLSSIVHCRFFHWKFCSTGPGPASFSHKILNLKAWWGVYWSPDPFSHSLNWFMDSISGATGSRCACWCVWGGSQGIHHPDRASSAAPEHFCLSRPLQMWLALSLAWPEARPHAETHTHTQLHLDGCGHQCTETLILTHLILHHRVPSRLNAKGG